MRIYYRDPEVQEDGSILLEQVAESGEMQLPLGIKKQELLVTREWYPSKDLLIRTVKEVEASYENPALHGGKSMIHLQLEKEAMKDLKEMIKKL